MVIIGRGGLIMEDVRTGFEKRGGSSAIVPNLELF